MTKDKQTRIWTDGQKDKWTDDQTDVLKGQKDKNNLGRQRGLKTTLYDVMN